MTDAFQQLFNERQWALDKASYKAWQHALSDCDDSEIEFSKMCLAEALRTELTETQRLYLLARYDQDLSFVEIGELYGVDKSTVCRTINRAEDRLFKVLRYSNRRFFKCPQPLHRHSRKGWHKHGKAKPDPYCTA